MDLKEAQNIAFRLLNLKSDNITLKEIKSALAILANFYEDYRYVLENKTKKSKDRKQ